MSLARALLVVMFASAIAYAEPKRVLVVDADAELVHAIETSLAPWKLVVIAQSDGVDPTLVAARAIQADAQFIVWRDGSELVVYDRERDVTERRPAKAGTMDPVAAAGAALTVKTMMRLPDPAEETTPPPPNDNAVVTGPSTGVILENVDRIRVHAGFGVDTAPALRCSLAVMLRPLSAPLRIGLAGEIASTTVDGSGYVGTARDYAVLALASYSFPVDRFEIEPFAAFGANYDVVDAEKNAQMTMRETALLPVARVGVAGWWYVGDWGLGLTAGANFFLGTRTYTKETGMGVIYSVPTVEGAISFVAAWRR